MASTINASTSPAAIVQTADGTGILALQTAGTTAVTVTAAQNVGIGTTSPTSKLTLNNGASGTDIRLQNTASGVGSGNGLDIGLGSAGDNGYIYLYENGYLYFATNATERMRIDSSGNVGIGTTSPDRKLNVTGAAATQTVIKISGSTTEGSFLQTSNTGGNFYIGKDNSAGTAFGSAYCSALYSDGAYPMIFWTNGTERMRIESTGVVLIGSATVFSGANSKLSTLWDPASQNGFTLKASGTTFSNYAIAFRTSTDTTSGYISQAASSVTYSTSSDYRLKENIVPMTGALDKVALLKPVTYTWKINNSAGQGFIAHELKEVVPDCVIGEKDAVEIYTDEEGNEQTRIKPQGVDTSFLVATLTAAIQEQQALITSLTARITALEGA